MGGVLYITGALADGGVTTAKLAADAVTTAKIADDAVTDAKLANSINSAIAANTAKTSLENNSVTTARIADEAVTLAKLEHGTSSNDGKFLRANNGADPSFETITVPVGIPSGGIIIWSGASNAIPSGFVLCDGNNSTPDLRNRFIVGAGSTYSVADTGGADSVTLSTSEMPAHIHSQPDHNHSFSGSNTHGHDFKGTFQDSGSTYRATVSRYNATTNPDYRTISSGSFSGVKDATITVSGTTGNADPNTNSSGGGGSHENRPPYYALCYIMKT
jgi:microcystin-dependent protein